MPMGGRAAEGTGEVGAAMGGSGLDCWKPRGLWRGRGLTFVCGGSIISSVGTKEPRASRGAA
jgi:hypothetical protein